MDDAQPHSKVEDFAASTSENASSSSEALGRAAAHAGGATAKRGRQVSSRFMTGSTPRRSTADTLGAKDQAAGLAMRLTMPGTMPSALKQQQHMHAAGVAGISTVRRGSSMALHPATTVFLASTPSAATAAHAAAAHRLPNAPDSLAFNPGPCSHAMQQPDMVQQQPDLAGPPAASPEASWDSVGTAISSMQPPATRPLSGVGTAPSFAFMTPIAGRFPMHGSAAPSGSTDDSPVVFTSFPVAALGGAPGPGGPGIARGGMQAFAAGPVASSSTPAALSLGTRTTTSSQGAEDRRLALQRFKEERSARRESLAGGQQTIGAGCSGRGGAFGEAAVPSGQPQLRRESLPGSLQGGAAGPSGFGPTTAGAPPRGGGAVGPAGMPPMVPRLKLGVLARMTASGEASGQQQQQPGEGVGAGAGLVAPRGGSTGPGNSASVAAQGSMRPPLPRSQSGGTYAGSRAALPSSSSLPLPTPSLAPLPTERARAAAHVPLPDSANDAALATPRSPQQQQQQEQGYAQQQQQRAFGRSAGQVSKSPPPQRSPSLRSPGPMRATTSPRVTADTVPQRLHMASEPGGAAGASTARPSILQQQGTGAATGGLDGRAELKALRVQELQLRFVNARMQQSLEIRSRKNERALAACALSIAQLQDAVGVAEVLVHRQALEGRARAAAALLGPALEQWGSMQEQADAASGRLSQAMQDALSNVPFINGAFCGTGHGSRHALASTSVAGGSEQADVPAHVQSLMQAMGRAEAALQVLGDCASALQPPASASAGSRSSSNGGVPPPTAWPHPHQPAAVPSARQQQQGPGYEASALHGPDQEQAAYPPLPTAALLTELTSTVKEEVVVLGRVLSMLRQLQDKRQLVGSYEAQLCDLPLS